MTTIDTLILRITAFHLRCLAREQLADYQLRLVKADNKIEAEALRYSIARVRQALVEVEMVA